MNDELIKERIRQAIATLNMGGTPTSRMGQASRAAGELTDLLEEMEKSELSPDSPVTWSGYVAGMIGEYIGEPIDSPKVKAIAGIIERRLPIRIRALQPDAPKPVDMVLYCPKCHTQHIDADNSDEIRIEAAERGYTHGTRDWEHFIEKNEWTNPPHKSHLCHGCGHIWRPSDTPTNGVKATASGKDADTVPVFEASEFLVEAEWPDRFAVPLEVICFTHLGNGKIGIRVKAHEPREAILKHT